MHFDSIVNLGCMVQSNPHGAWVVLFMYGRVESSSRRMAVWRALHVGHCGEQSTQVVMVESSPRRAWWRIRRTTIGIIGKLWDFRRKPQDFKGKRQEFIGNNRLESLGWLGKMCKKTQEFTGRPWEFGGQPQESQERHGTSDENHRTSKECDYGRCEPLQIVALNPATSASEFAFEFSSLAPDKI